MSLGLGFGFGLTSYRGGGAPWSPLELFADGTDGALWGPWDVSTLFQDAAGTTPVTAGGDPVGRVVDKSGNSVPLSQSALANSFTAVRMPLTGRRNLLTWSEAFDNAAWLKQSGTSVVANTAIAPDGTLTGDLVQNLNAAAGDRVSQDMTIAPATLTGSIWLKGEGDNIGKSVAITVKRAGGGAFSGATTNHTLTSEWVRVSATFTMLPENVGVGIYLTTTGDDTATDVLVWGAQLELGSIATPYQRVTNAFDVTEAGVPDCYYLRPDLTDDALTTVLPQAINGEILIAGTNGTIIEPVSYASGSTFNLGTDSYTGGTPGILRAIGPIVGVVLLDRAFTDTEKAQLIAYYKGKGAKGLLVPGPELRGDAVTALHGSATAATYNASTGEATAYRVNGSNQSYIALNDLAASCYEIDIQNISGGTLIRPSVATSALVSIGSGVRGTYIVPASALAITPFAGNPSTSSFTIHSIKELRAEEDW